MSSRLISERAAWWLVRLEGQTDSATWDEFQTWLDTDVRHRAAFIRLRVIWVQTEVLRRLRPLDGMIDADLLVLDHERPAQSRAYGSDERMARDRRKIAMAPGSQLAAVAEFLLTRASYKRYVRPVIADMQEEYIDCIAHGRSWKARWVAVRGHFLVVPSWIYALLSRAAKRFLN